MTKLADSDQGSALVFENLSQEELDDILADYRTREDKSSLAQLVQSVKAALRPEDLAKTRLVLAGDLVAAVNAREDRPGNAYTMERGGGIVAAKTMPPNADGVVDILVPIYWLLSTEDRGAREERDRYIQHVAAHEAVHASIFHDGKDAFDVHRRRDYGNAMVQFVSMAAHQVEEHLAEYLANRTELTPAIMTVEQLSASFRAWDQIIEEELPAVSRTDPNYFQKCMMMTLTALHDLWKVLSYYAAELRDDDDSFSHVPAEIADLSFWREEVARWWGEYTALLAQIPMSIPVDVSATDQVVDKIARLLQRWAMEIGVDHHDIPQGPWFQMTRAG
ncbi:hypothetical protein KPL76_00105 [Subtercola sp. PAMC28395]|uniref:hypothetical protein n=1 Tax=Subtercola sp. PAMC28395 TaxID=2846775 RepID=UPI001C0AB04A|nr:hypothetical protein [Subtercola sp. PAMC28395]QWT23900.1 hypothetical protein KPL76_00105 [Subtercola sp. PAMC28395]